jgi:hypothetical protein
MSEPNALIDAKAICPVCGSYHSLRINPLYPPPLAKLREQRANCPHKPTKMSVAERARYFYFRVKCDRCMALSCTLAMRKILQEKGWDVQ